MRSITEIYAEKRAAFIHHTPFGVLLEHDLFYLLRATARDTGWTMAEVRQECGL